MKNANHLDRLTAALHPSLGKISPHLYCSFKVRRLARPDLVWVNYEWFTQKGLIGPNCTAAILREWILTRFAYGVPSTDSDKSDFLDEEVIFLADRYGSTGGSTHGGSGRVGTLGSFNVKGVGPTPLVAVNADWHHSHGFMWMEEAIREAIFSQVVAKGFPYGAIPVLAVIGTGIKHRLKDSGEVEERALIVRPNFMRISSLQRSVFFGSSGFEGSSQSEDFYRVRDTWQTLWSPEGEAIREFYGAPTLTACFYRIGTQYGFGHATRLWPGPAFSSNLGLNGSLLDFGAMRSVGSWSRVQSKLPTHSFGGEERMIFQTAADISRLSQKYYIHHPIDQLTDAYRDGRQAGFALALEKHGVSTTKDLNELTLAFDNQQQRRGSLWESMESYWPYENDLRYPSLFRTKSNLSRDSLRIRILNFLRKFPPSVKGRHNEISSFIEHEVSLGS